MVGKAHKVVGEGGGRGGVHFQNKGPTLSS